MLPGRTFMPEDLLLILRRRFWLLIVPFAVVSAATALYVRFLPDVYEANALISIVPPKVPDAIVKAASAPIKMEDRIPSIKNEILSRTRLERIIQDLNLYPVERRTGIMEDIVERMRSEIDVRAAGTSAIRVSFTGDEPKTVTRVADKLAGIFIDESTKDRKLMIEGTDQFLDAQLKETLQRLTEKEQAVLEYRRKNDGQLPDQVGANQSGVQNQQSLIVQLSTAIDKAETDRRNYQKQIDDIESQSPTLESMEVVVPGQAPSTATQLRLAQKDLNDKKAVFTDITPTVRAAQAKVDKLQQQLDAEMREAPVSGRASPVEQERQRRLTTARANLEQAEANIARYQRDLAAARKSLQEYIGRVMAASSRQTDMVALNRDYGTIQTLYNSLLQQKEQSNLAANLERREIGEQFRLVDAAHTPSRPSSPNRERLNLLGMGVGLLIGVALVAFVEYRDMTLKTDDELTRVLGVPVLAVVPLMLSEQERRRAWQRKLAVGTVLGGTVFACLTVLAYTFVR